MTHIAVRTEGSFCRRIAVPLPEEGDFIRAYFPRYKRVEEKQENGRSGSKIFYFFCEVRCAAWQRKAKKEIAEGWAWLRKHDPRTAKSTERWAEENSEEMREVDRMLYRSDERYYEKTSALGPEAGNSIVDPEAFLPEYVRDRLYDDKAWYVRDKYLPDGFDGDAALHLPKDIISALQGLTELQREVIFRSIVNGEDTASIAEDKNCSARNIRDIRNRALKCIRTATAGREGSGYPDAMLFILWSILICAAGYFLLAPNAVAAWIRTVVFIALPIVTVASVCVIVHRLRKLRGVRRQLTSLKSDTDVHGQK